MSKTDPKARLIASGVFRYGLSVISVAVSLSITLLLGDYTFRTPLFFPAIILSTWLGGTGPGLLAVLLSALSINFFFLEPRYTFAFGLHDLPHLVVFLFSALVVSSWSAARKRAENRLRDSEQRWRGLTEALPQLVWGATSDGACDYFSTQWTDYTGVPETELLGWQWMKLLHPDDREPTRKLWTDSVAGHAPYDVEYRVQRKDGIYGWFKTRGAPIRDEKGNIEKWFGTCTDITDRKQAEASLLGSEYELRKARDELEEKVAERTADLQRTNEQLQQEVAERRRVEEILRERASLLDLTHDTVFVRDMHDVITYWNRGAEELYGWTTQEAVGQVSHELARTVFPAPLDEINRELLTTGRWEGELIHTKRDGTRVTVASRWSLQRDEQHNPSAILETNNDVTDRKRAEEALRQSRDELEIKVKERTAELRKTNADLESVNKELEAFAYSVSHDLRAPVRHIAGFTELLQKHSEAVLDDKSRHHIGMILDSAKRMGQLVDDLLAFSRIGRAETQKTTVHLEKLIKDVVAETAPDTQGRNLVWRIGSLPICHGDPSMLRLVFANLVSNAVKFTRTREQAEIQIDSLNDKPDEVVVFVKDNGVGFDMKYNNKLFGVFQRLHSQEAFEGTGIGLATVQRIVHRHGGRVWAESSLDKGATFYVALPKPGNIKT